MVRQHIRPTREINVVITVHDCSVSFSLMARYRLTSQNPESLTWDNIVAPEDTAITSKPKLAGETGLSSKIGEIKPALVIIATVADP